MPHTYMRHVHTKKPENRKVSKALKVEPFLQALAVLSAQNEPGFVCGCVRESVRC